MVRAQEAAAELHAPRDRLLQLSDLGIARVYVRDARDVGMPAVDAARAQWHPLVELDFELLHGRFPKSMIKDLEPYARMLLVWRKGERPRAAQAA